MNKKITVLLMLLICALSISAVSAEDGDATAVANFTDLQTTIDDASGDSVDLSSDYTKNVTASESYVKISKNITINGNNHVIDGSKGTAFVISKNSSVTINDLTFIDSSRAIFNYGNVILNNCTFINNNGAISSSSGSTLDVNNCKFINNTRTSAYAMGGAISATNATVKISGSKFINNSAVNADDNSGFAFGGAIFVQGGTNLTVVNSQFTTNKANSKNNNAQGGAIFAWSDVQKVSIENCEFTDNSAVNGGAIYTDSYTDLSVKNSKFNGNSAIGDSAVGSGGAIFSEGNIDVDNSTFADNTATNGGAIYAASTSEKNVIIKDSKFNGNTATHTDDTKGGEGGAILLLGSVESSVSGCTFEDNAAKFFGGAISAQGTSLTVTDTTLKGNTAYNKGGAIYNQGTLTVDNCVLDSNKVTTTTVDPVTYEGAQGSAIFCNNGSTLVISDSEIVNNYNIVDAKSYGAVTVGGTDATITGTKFVNNTGGFGGAVSAVRHRISGTGPINPSTLYVEDCIFENNTAYAGAAIAATASNYTVVNSTFANNNASSRYGGAIYAGRDGYENTSYGKITGSTFTDNTAIIGGAIAFANVDATVIDDCTFEGNTATSMGGAIGSPDTKTENVAVTNSLFKDNEAKYGGAIYTAAPLDVDASKFENNSASYYGGAIYTGKHADVSNSEFVDNTAPIGSAIFSYPDAAVLELDNVTSNKKNSFYDNGTYIDDNVTYITETTLNNITIYAGANVTVAGNVAPNATGNVIVTIGDVVKTTTVVDGAFEVDMGTFDAGNYTIVVEFAKDGKYLASEGNAFLTVLPTVITSDVIKYFRNGTQYTITVLDANGNPVANKTVPVALSSPNWKTPVIYNIVTNENGTATLAINLIPGEYGIVAEVDDKEYPNTITVLPMTYSLSAEDIYMTFRDGTNYVVTLVDADGNPVADKTVAITLTSPSWKGSVTYNVVTDENGVASLPINLAVGTYTAKSVFGAESVTTKINVLKSAYKIETADVVKYFKNGTQYTVTVKDLNGNAAVNKTVAVTLTSSSWSGSVTYNIVTNENGTATLTINLAAGSYSVSAEVDGNVAKNSIRVLPILTTESISKPVNQPASLFAKLVDGQGNPAAGKTVIFTVKTKSYDILTGENGIAALPINLGMGKWTIQITDPDTGAKATATVIVTKAIS